MTLPAAPEILTLAVPAIAVVKAVYAVLVLAGLLLLARSLPTL